MSVEIDSPVLPRRRDHFAEQKNKRCGLVASTASTAGWTTKPWTVSSTRNALLSFFFFWIPCSPSLVSYLRGFPRHAPEAFLFFALTRAFLSYFGILDNVPGLENRKYMLVRHSKRAVRRTFLQVQVKLKQRDFHLEEAARTILTATTTNTNECRTSSVAGLKNKKFGSQSTAVVRYIFDKNDTPRVGPRHLFATFFYINTIEYYCNLWSYRLGKRSIGQ